MNNSNSGWSIIEFSLIATLLLSLITGLVGVVDHFNKVRALEELVDQALYNFNQTPYLIQTVERYNEGLVASRNKLDEGFNDTLAKFKANLVRDVCPSASCLRQSTITLSAHEVAVDVNSGRCGQSAQLLSNVEFGNLTHEAGSNKHLVQAQINALSQNLISINEACVIAVPTARFVLAASEARQVHYIPKSLLISLAVSVDLSSSFGGKMYKLIGGEALARSVKTVATRGDVG